MEDCSLFIIVTFCVLWFRLLRSYLECLLSFWAQLCISCTTIFSVKSSSSSSTVLRYKYTHTRISNLSCLKSVMWQWQCFLQVVITGVVLVHTGRKPSKCLVQYEHTYMNIIWKLESVANHVIPLMSLCQKGPSTSSSCMTKLSAVSATVVLCNQTFDKKSPLCI